MAVEEDIYSFLTGNAGVAALVGTRVYPLMLPQDCTLPAVAYRRVDTPRIYSHQGYSGLARPRFQFDCLAASYASASAVAEAVRSAFAGWREAYGGTAFVQGEQDVPWLEATEHFQVSVDVIIWHSENH